MKYLIAILFLFTLGFTNAQTPSIEETQTWSLAKKTGETTSLWNALANYYAVNATEWTVADFRQAADTYAQSIGLEYTNHAENGWNNIEILHYSPNSTTIKLTHSTEVYAEVPMIGTIHSVDTTFKKDTTTYYVDSTLDTINIKVISLINQAPTKQKKVDNPNFFDYTAEDAFNLYKESCKLARLASKKGNNNDFTYYVSKAKLYKNDYRTLLPSDKAKSSKKKKSKKFRPKKRMPFLSKKWCNHAFGCCLK